MSEDPVVALKAQVEALEGWRKQMLLLYTAADNKLRPLIKDVPDSLGRHVYDVAADELKRLQWLEASLKRYAGRDCGCKVFGATHVCVSCSASDFLVGYGAGAPTSAAEADGYKEFLAESKMLGLKSQGGSCEGGCATFAEDFSAEDRARLLQSLTLDQGCDMPPETILSYAAITKVAQLYGITLEEAKIKIEELLVREDEEFEAREFPYLHKHDDLCTDCTDEGPCYDHRSGGRYDKAKTEGEAKGEWLEGDEIVFKNDEAGRLAAWKRQRAKGRS